MIKKLVVILAVLALPSAALACHEEEAQAAAPSAEKSELLAAKAKPKKASPIKKPAAPKPDAKG